MPIISGNLSVALSGTPQPISTTRLLVSWATVQALLTNTQPVTVQDLNGVGGFTLVNPGDSIVLWPVGNANLLTDLNHVQVRVLVNGEGIQYIANK